MAGSLVLLVLCFVLMVLVALYTGACDALAEDGFLPPCTCAPGGCPVPLPKSRTCRLRRAPRSVPDCSQHRGQHDRHPDVLRGHQPGRLAGLWQAGGHVGGTCGGCAMPWRPAALPGPACDTAPARGGPLERPPPCRALCRTYCSATCALWATQWIPRRRSEPSWMPCWAAPCKQSCWSAPPCRRDGGCGGGPPDEAVGASATTSHPACPAPCPQAMTWALCDVKLVGQPFDVMVREQQHTRRSIVGRFQRLWRGAPCLCAACSRPVPPPTVRRTWLGPFPRAHPQPCWPPSTPS